MLGEKLFPIILVFLYVIVFVTFYYLRTTQRSGIIKVIARKASSQKVLKYYQIAKNNLLKSFFLLLISICLALPGLIILYDNYILNTKTYSIDLIINTIIASSSNTITREESIFIILFFSFGGLITGLFTLRLLSSSIMNFWFIQMVIFHQKRSNNGNI
jgi:hypothetical protein